MKSFFTLLGTSSCEGIPAPFCTCKLCNYARQHGGRERRRRFSVAVNDELIIDFGPDAVCSMRDFGIDETKVKHICITHNHADHFQPLDLLWRTALDTVNFLNIAGNFEVKANYESLITREYGNKIRNNFAFHEAVPGKVLKLGDYELLPVRASHMKYENCALNYLITTPQKRRLLILADTGWWCEESFETMRGAMADAVITELSCGTKPGEDVKRVHHLGAKAVMDFLEVLKAQNSVKPDAQCVTSHISHVPQTTQSELEEYFKETGVTAGYDGLRIEF